MKGHQKQFSRYLQSEYNDYSLEPLDKKKYLDKALISDKKIPQEQEKLPRYIQSKNDKSKRFDNIRYHQRNDTKDFLNRDLLSKDPFRDFTFEFSPEVRENIESHEQIEILRDSVLFDLKNYSFEYPMIFLSCLPQEPVFVWKITGIWRQPNRKDANSSHKEAEVGILAALTVFAKINVLCDEKLVETKFLGSNWIYTKSKQGETQLSVRVYCTNGYLRMRENFINTMHTHSVSAISSPICEVNIQNFKNAQGSTNYFKVSLCKSAGDIENNTVFEGVHHTTHVFRGFDNFLILVDSDNANIVTCKDGMISILDCKIKKIKSVYQVEKSLFMKNEDDMDYQVTWDQCGEMQIKKVTTSEDIWKAISKINQNLARKNKVIEHFSNPKHLYYSTDFQLVYIYPLFVKNPESIAGLKVEIVQDQNDKQSNTARNERSLVEEIKRIKKEHRNGNNKGETIEMKKEMLKQIRKEIGTKMREISKFDEEYKTGQGDMGTEELKEPERVSKEMLDLYAKIKAEKKSLYREKGKKKKKHSKEDRSE